MKTIREYIDLIESAQPVDLRAQAAELAIQILKNADMDDDSEQGYIRVDPNALFQFHILMNTVKKQGVAEALSKNDLIGKLQKDLGKVRTSKPKSKVDPNAWARGDLYTGAQDQEDIDQMSRRDTGEPRPTVAQRAKDPAVRNKRNGAVEEDQATARMGLMSAVGSDSGEPDRQRMAAQAIERLHNK